jgi:hypothetical protein
VNAPPQKIVINAPPPAQVNAPAAYASPPAAYVPTGANIPTGRATPALGVDWVRIRVPILRLFAVPTQPEMAVVPATGFATAPSPSFVAAPQGFVAAPQNFVAAPQNFVAAPQSFVAAPANFVAQPAPQNVAMVPATNFVAQPAAFTAVPVQQPAMAQMLVTANPAPPATFAAPPAAMQGMECRLVCTPTGSQPSSQPQPNNPVDNLRNDIQSLEMMLPRQAGAPCPSR